MIPYYKPPALYPYFDDESNLLENIDTVIANGTYTKGELVKEFSDKIAKRTGYEYVIALGSGTAALFILARFYWKIGHRKIRVPAFTWCSSYKPFEWLGYRIRFVDIDRGTWLADFGDMKHDTDELLLPVDTFGSVYPNDHPYAVIDSAQSLGAKWPDDMPNRIVSLSGSKIITTGEGGLLLTQNEELVKFATKCQWFSRMPEMSAALGLAYLEKLDAILEKKRKIAFEYEKTFGNLGNGSVQFQKFPVDSNHYIVAGLVDSPKAWAKANPDVEFRNYYLGMVSESDEYIPYEETKADSLPRLVNTEYVSRHIIAFPSWPDMNLDAIKEMKEPT